MESPAPFHHFKEPVPYETFELYMKHNLPCTFGPWISEDWPASTDWVDEDGSPNLTYLEEQYGACEASVTRFNNSSDFDCYKQTISQFIGYWRTLIASREVSDADSFPSCHFESLPHYLKDWHFAKNTAPNTVYHVPEIFTDDWLNRYWKTRNDVKDDYIFSYFGPAGSYTPFHADVFRSYSWSVNVCGCKKWLILYPGEELKLDESQLNVANRCLEKGLEYKILYQWPGEGIFIPSGWWHQVLNTADTISINHNWANFHCVPRMWNYLTSELQLVEKEISDCRELMTDQEWFEQCQLVLRANIGLDYSEFLDFVLMNLMHFSFVEYETLVEDLGVVKANHRNPQNLSIVCLKTAGMLYDAHNITHFLRMIIPFTKKPL